MKRAIVALLVLGAIAHADTRDPKRKVVVLEYRAGSSALPKVTGQLVATMAKQTSLQVLGPEQTKTLYGERLEESIVKCAGEAECVAKIGAKVGAAEVILVGISELGDVILTMQRIDVATRSVSARIADSLAANAAPSEDQLGNYVTRLLPPTDFIRWGVIAISANESGAAVSVGNEARGVTPIEPLRLHAPATYNIRIEKQGYVPFTTKVQLPPDSEIKVEAELSRRGGATHWYQKWWVLTGIAVGAAVLGGGVYLATRSPPDTVGVSGELK